MKVTVVMASGKEIDFECDDAEAKRSLTTGGLSSFKLIGIKGRHFLHINLDRVDAVLYEKTEEA